DPSLDPSADLATDPSPNPGPAPTVTDFAASPFAAPLSRLSRPQLPTPLPIALRLPRRPPPQSRNSLLLPDRPLNPPPRSTKEPHLPWMTWT
ncbi:MAG: hypothetical protein ACO35Q_12230, partial [Prochlorothrix sp.]